MKTVRLEFGKQGKEIAESLSALVRIDDSLYAGGDEGLHLARLEARDAGKRFKLKELIDLSDWFDLPMPPPSDPTKKIKEIDLEGMDYDDSTRRLWLLGSHSLKRGQAKPGVDAAKNLKALGKVRPDANRFFLGCVTLSRRSGSARLSAPGPGARDARAAQLQGDATTSDLLDQLRRDELFARFCVKGAGIPGKDNGIDIEGLACGPSGRVLVGLRGPVLRGIATVLEIAPLRVDSPGSKADRLELAAIGPGGCTYRRHFLDLAGHGIRDLCWHGDDLLVLAGPTMDLDAPPLVYRWQAARGAFGKNSGDEEQFHWRADGALVPVPIGTGGAPEEPGTDHAEAIAWLDKKRLVIGYDSPSGKRLRKPATIAADAVEL